MKKTLISSFVIINILISNTIYAAPLTPMPYGGVVVIDRNNNCTETDFAAIDNTDISRGDSLVAALNHVRTGNGNIDGDLGLSNQSIYISQGIFNIGTSTIDLTSSIFRIITEGDIENPTTTEDILMRNLKNSNNMHGSGKNITQILSTVHGSDSLVALKPSPDSQITDLSITSGSIDTPDYSFPFGIAYEPIMPSTYNMGTVFLKNVSLSSQSDGIYFFTNAIDMTLNVINVTSNSGWDNIALINGNGLIMNIYDSVFNANGVSSLTNTNYHGINDLSSGATFNIYNSVFNVAGKNNVYGVYTNHVANIFNTVFNLSITNGSGTLYSLFTYAGGFNNNALITISPSVTYNRITSGNIATTTEQIYTAPIPPTEPCPHPFRSTPTVVASTTPISNINTDSVTLNGNIDNDGLLNNTQVGFKYSIDSSYSNSVSINGNFSTGYNFSKNITGLSCGTTYNYQIFSTNSEGIGTSTNQTFTTSVCPIIPSTSGGFSGGSSISNNELNKVVQVLKQEAKKILFNKNLYLGTKDTEVRLLQQYLNNNNYIVNIYGPGSSGNETTYFGIMTKKALSKFQSDNNIKPSIGFFGPKTRDFINNQ